MANPKFVEDPNMPLRDAGGIPFDPKTLGDGEIIRATKQITSEQGLTQFRMTMPSGREIESEWLREDQLKRALLPWIETIRAELQSDADEVRAKARRESEERKLRQQPKAPVLVSPSGGALTAEPELPDVLPTSRTLPSRSTTPVAVPSSTASTAAADSLSSPYEFARKGYEAAKAAERFWANEAEKATAAWIKANEDLLKWQNILAAVGEPKEVAIEQDTGIRDTNSAGSGNKPRRGRPAGSRNKPKVDPGAVVQSGN